MDDLSLPPPDPPRPEGLTLSLTSVMVAVFAVEIVIVTAFLLFVPEFTI